jgi:hypothetical protein
MARLLRLELRRLFKDKVILAMAIILVVIAFFQALVAGTSYYEDPWTGTIYWTLTMRDLLSTSFQLSSTPFIIIGIVVAVFLAKDVNQGTIRNKLIAGYSKMEIYWTSTISATFITFVSMVLFHGLSIGFGQIWGIPFPIDTTVVNDLENFLIYMAIGYLLVFVATSIINFIAMMVKNMAGVIVLSIVFMVFVLVFALLLDSLLKFWLVYNRYDLYTQAQQAQDALDRLQGVLDYFYIFQALKYSTSLFNPTDFTNFYSDEGRIYLFKVLGTNFGLLALLNLGGAYLFSRTDLK